MINFNDCDGDRVHDGRDRDDRDHAHVHDYGRGRGHVCGFYVLNCCD